MTEKSLKETCAFYFLPSPFIILVKVYTKYSDKIFLITFLFPLFRGYWQSLSHLSEQLHSENVMFITTR